MTPQMNRLRVARLRAVATTKQNSYAPGVPSSLSRYNEKMAQRKRRASAA
jgi:hypothetical protein